MTIPCSWAGRSPVTTTSAHRPWPSSTKTLARILWPNEGPLGHRLRLKGEALEVVGVARDIKGNNLFDAPGPMLYLPLSQHYDRT